MKIETERLIIRPLQTKDRQAMYDVLVDFEKSEYRLYDYKPPTEMEKIEMLIPFWVRSSRYFTLELKETGQTIGFISLDDGEIGFSIKSDYHRKGYGYESVKAFMDFIAEKRKIKYFTAQAALENIPCVSLLKKLGFNMVSTEAVQYRVDYPPVLSGNFKLEI